MIDIYDDYPYDDSVTIDYDSIERETSQSYLFNICEELIWLPKSQVIVQTDTQIILPEWLAKDKGLI